MRKINPKNFKTATRGTSREINRQIALTLIRSHQPVSHADLARLMETNRTNVTFLINELLGDKLVREGATGEEVTEAWDLVEPTVHLALKERPLTKKSGETMIRIVPADEHPRRRGAVANPLTPGAQFAAVSPLPETHQWNIGIQRQLPFGLIADVSYVGTRGIFLPLDARDFNSVPLERFEKVARVGTAQATQNARPFPTIGTLNAFENVGNSIYHSGQFKLTRRFSGGFGITANYTFSKSIDDGSGIFNFSQPNSLDRGYLPTFNSSLDRALSAFDRPHNLTAAVQYKLPFGKGQMFLNNPNSAAGKIARAVFGGFQINVLTSARSGLPDTITISGISTLSLSQPRPNQIAGLQLQTVNQAGANGTIQYFQPVNSANFPFTPVGPLYVGAGATRAQILPFTIGGTGRNTVRAPAQYNTDISLVRRFSLNERMNLNFRVEAFNAFNRANLIFDPAGTTTNLPVIVQNGQAVFSALLFGVIDRALPARRLQLVARFEF